jgi:hypothetical protein
MKAALKVKVCLAFAAILATVFTLLIGGCTKEKVIIYHELPGRVVLAYPPNSIDSVYASTPTFKWMPQAGAVGYHIQIASDAAFSGIEVGQDAADTFFTPAFTPPHTRFANGFHYWRVRAQNDKGIWGDWSDAAIWTFNINDNSNYVRLLSQSYTYGIAQDLIVENNIAYVADGEAELTLFNVSDASAPTLIGNIDMRTDDFAKGVWKKPGDNYAYVADRNGRMQVLDVSLPLNPYALGNSGQGLDQSLEDVMGVVYQDSLFLLSVASGTRNIFRLYNIIYDPLPHTNPNYSVNEIQLPADGMGVYWDTMSVYVQYHDTLKLDSTYYEFREGRFIYVADASAGLGMIDISITHPFDFPDSVIDLMGSPRVIGWVHTPSEALSVQARGKYAYVADDRAGLQIYRLPDTIPSFDNVTPFRTNPILVGSMSTSGRAKDLQLVGDYCFLADASGGLKVINIANPAAPAFVAAYTTPYAYGIWADSSKIYIADRDLGLLIFDNLLF